MRKSKVLLFLILGMFVVFQSCQKKGLVSEKEKVIEEVGVSEINDEYTGQFKKEFSVSDENGNTAFYVAYCKNEDELNEFIKNTEFTLTTNDFDIEAMVNVPVSEEDNNIDKNTYQEDEEYGIAIELISTNLKSDVENWSLNVKEDIGNGEKRLRYKSWKTSGDIIGIINYGRSIYARTMYTDCFFCSWYRNSLSSLYTNNDQKYIRKGSHYKVGIEIKYNTSYSYSYAIRYSETNFRGTSCTIGTYESRTSCYVATAPSGTSPFMYPNNVGNFYYTAVNGNQCPLPGSWYDGANCYVCDIPNYTTTYGYIVSYNRKMYVRTELMGQ